MCGWTAFGFRRIPTLHEYCGISLTCQHDVPSAPVALPAGDRQQREQWATCARQLSRGQAVSFSVVIGGAKGHVCSIECTPAGKAVIPSCLKPLQSLPYLEAASTTLTGCQDVTPYLSLTSHYFASSRVGHAVTLTARHSSNERPLATEVGVAQAWSPPKEGEAHVEITFREKQSDQHRWRVSQRVAMQWEGVDGLPAPGQLKPKFKTALDLPWAQWTTEYKPKMLGQQKAFAKLGVKQRASKDEKGKTKSWNADLTRVAEQRTTLQFKGNYELPGWRLRQQLRVCSQNRTALELRMRQSGAGRRPWQLLAKTNFGDQGKIGVGRVFKCEDAAHGVVWEAELETSRKAVIGVTFQSGSTGTLQTENGVYVRCGAKCFTELSPLRFERGTIDVRAFFLL